MKPLKEHYYLEISGVKCRRVLCIRDIPFIGLVEGKSCLVLDIYQPEGNTNAALLLDGITNPVEFRDDWLKPMYFSLDEEPRSRADWLQVRTALGNVK